MQPTLVILIVAGCVVWLGVMAYRHLRMKAGGSCGGGCCGGMKAPEGQAGAGRTQMVSAEDLRNRVKARG